MNESSSSNSEAQLIAQASKKEERAIRAISIFLWAVALLVAVFPIVLLALGKRDPSVVATWLIVLLEISAVYLMVTGMGLWRRKKWGAILLALFLIIGYINHLIRHASDMLAGDVGEVLFHIVLLGNLVIVVVETRRIMRTW